MPQLVNAFPLSVFVEDIPEHNEMKPGLVEEIRNRAGTPTEGSFAWTGDRNGHGFLHLEPVFKPLFACFGRYLRMYLQTLELRADLIDLYYQRSWPVVTRRTQNVALHHHQQSHISIAYYLKKTPQSGGISFVMNSAPNEVAPGLFHPQMQSFLKNNSPLNSNRVNLNPEEGQIVIFPSKTLHETVPSEDDEEWISISADVGIILRDSDSTEFLMPPFEKWGRVE